MTRYIILLLIILTLCISCIHHASIQLDIPKREELPVPIFSRAGEEYCTTADGIKAILKRDAIRDSYEQQLINTIDGCNKILK